MTAGKLSITRGLVGRVRTVVSRLRARVVVIVAAVATSVTVSTGTALAAGLGVKGISAKAPAGSALITKGMSWGMWAAALAIYAAVALHSARMAHAHRNNGGAGLGEHAKGIAGALGAATVIGIAPSLINGLS